MIAVRHAPHQISEGFARQRGRVRQRRQVLAYLLWVGVVLLELGPLGLERQLAQFTYQTNEKAYWPVSGHMMRPSAPHSTLMVIFPPKIVGGSHSRGIELCAFLPT